MGWEMLFWVVVIVAVPTVIWFLLSEPPPRPSLKPEDVSNVVFLRRPTRGKDEHAEENAELEGLQESIGRNGR